MSSQALEGPDLRNLNAISLVEKSDTEDEMVDDLVDTLRQNKLIVTLGLIEGQKVLYIE